MSIFKIISFYFFIFIFRNKYFFNYIYGLCFQSPYTWRDENPKDLYKDSLGVFDKNRQKILECLYKNHDYKTKSEVAKIKTLARH